MLSSLINQQFGRYVITAILGRGGMAAVYRAHDTILQRDVAIKVLYPHYADEIAFVERFKREAVTVAALEHPHIGPIYDVGEHDGTVYIAMKLLSGHTLQDTLNARGKLTLDDLLPILDHVASALDYAHARDIVHRDIKPGNIMLDIPADTDTTHQLVQTHAILTDFGIAKNLDTTGLTTTGALIGTPDYMAPEQIGNRKVDSRTDIYALAMVAYRALTGRPAFDGSTQNVLLAHLHEQAPPPSSFNPQISPTVDAVLLQALAKDPDQRYASAGQFVQALRLTQSSHISNAAVVAPHAVTRPATPHILNTHPTPPATTASPRPVSSWFAAGMLVLLFILVGALAAMLFSGGGNNQGEDRTAATNPQGGIGLLATETATATPLEASATAVIFPTGEETAGPTAEPTSLPNVTATSAIIQEPPPQQPAPTQPPPAPPVTAAPPTTAPDPVEPDPPPTAVPPDTPEPTAPPTDTPEPTALACNERLFAGGFALLWDQNVEVRTAMGCPTEPLDPGRTVVQFFEGGTMYWWAETDTIYVFFGVAEGRYQVVGPIEAAKYAEPTPDPNNPNAPIRGFGRVYGGIPEVREELGAARTPEFDLDEPNRQGVRQRFDGGHMLFIPADVDPNSPSKLIFVLDNDETFTRYIDTYVD